MKAAVAVSPAFNINDCVDTIKGTMVEKVFLDTYREILTEN